MHVPKTARDCVVFLGDVTDRGAFRARATGFLVGVPSSDPRLLLPYLVTAEHVIVGLQQSGRQLYCRMNLKNGGVSVAPLKIDKWWYHPNSEIDPTDVAVAAIYINWDLADHICLPLPEKRPVNPIAYPAREVGLGDETFTLGLFRMHAGTDRNIPIVRIGNIAALPEEPVRTDWGLLQAYLVEMRSIAGLSGSPVFVDSPSIQTMSAFAGIVDQRTALPDPEKVNWFRYHFLGLIHGHFDVPDLQEDADSDGDAAVSAAQTKAINTGIGVVIPAAKIIETLYQADLIEDRRQLEEAIRKSQTATPDTTKVS